ncbi:PREDICTED: beta-1,3-galactosyltransferase 2-like isoform X1 [Cyprinodon variegatus]|uniref:Hexosyltransferase n=2 Tax=Cyprinodon variegatus TaxID=28743 RepID=A0A3Q2GCT5_CYPVA|nr:PREDICTED: beta-1,3-galactosyltransferase 2-like isoform X1 [Cyprinodon variegatus]
MGSQEAGSGEEICQRRQFAKDPYHHKSNPFHSWFVGLLALCLLVFVMFFAFSDNTLAWSEKLSLYSQNYVPFNQRPQFKAPPYRVHPKHKLITNAFQKNTKFPSVQPGGLQYHLAYPRNYQFIIDNTEICKDSNPFLVLMVPVKPKDIAARNAIRQTWGKDKVVQSKVVLTLFMLGLEEGADLENLKNENQQHQDLIQSNFIDTYLNLTIKTMVIMDWLATHCPTATYAMKVDSDMFLNIDNLIIMLQKPGIPKVNYLTGMLMWDRPVVRSKESKWYVPEELYPDPKYPTYTLGMGYVFSNDLPAKFVEVSKSIKPFNIEDAYIGMCTKKLGLSPTPPPNPSQFKAYNSRYDRCEFSQIITYILGSSEQLKNYWSDFKKPGPHC